MKALILAALLMSPVLGQEKNGVISGQVFHPNGSPAVNVRVGALSIPDSSLAPLDNLAISELGTTDGSGKFRLESLRPGRYLIIAGFVEFPTYYPGVGDKVRATILNVAAGASVSDIDFRVAERSTGLKVSGRVLGVSNLPPGTRLPLTVSMNSNPPLTATVNPDGAFEFLKVRPGLYSLRISSRVVNANSEIVTTRVDDRDIDDVEISLVRQKLIAGRLAIEGRGPTPRFSINLSSGSTIPGVPMPGRLDILPERDGTFEIRVPEGEWQVDSLADLPAGYRVKSFFYGNANLGRDPMKVSWSDPAELQLTLTSSLAPSKVSGRVVGAGKLETLSESARVTLISSSFAGIQTAAIADDGTFEFPEVFRGLYAIGIPGMEIPNASRKTITVEDADVRNVEIVVPPKKEIHGRVSVEGHGPMPRLTLNLLINSEPQPVHIDPEADGSFTVALFEGAYGTVDITLPPSYSLKAASYGAADLNTRPLFVSSRDAAEFQLKVAVDLTGVKVEGKVSGLTAPEGSKVSLHSSVYAGTQKTNLNRDGGFGFSEVFAGNYALRISGPGAPADRCIPVVVGSTDRKDLQIAAPRPLDDANDIQIVSAIFGASEGSADVTPIVSRLAKRGAKEFFAATQWMNVDPAVGQNKNLVISYLFRCEEHLFVTSEAGGVSHAMLVDNANPTMRLALPVDGSPKLTVVESFFGSGRQFQEVTDSVRKLMQPHTDSIVVDDASILNAAQSGSYKHLTITYIYGGKRNTFTVDSGAQLSYSILVRNAESGGQYSRALPGWFETVEPFVGREPGELGPGAGPDPRKELSIALLMKAEEELLAIRPEERNFEINDALSAIQRAIAATQVNINDRFPPAGSKPLIAVVTNRAKSAHLASALKATTTALKQLSAANPGARALFLTQAIDGTQQALADLRKISAGN